MFAILISEMFFIVLCVHGLMRKVVCCFFSWQFTDCLQAIVGSNSSRYCPHLITYVESAEGLLNMKHVLLMAEQFTKKGIYHLDGVVFGSDDYCADIGVFLCS